MRKIIWGLACLAFFQQMASAQHTFQPLSSEAGWRVFSTEHFQVYYTGDKGGAAQAARYAEKARYELGVFFDYKPEQTFTLVYAEHPHAWLKSNLSFGTPIESPGIFHLPDRFGLVLHPGTQKGLYQAVRKAVAQLILQEFSYGTQIGTTLQTQLLLNNTRWFDEGLLSYISEGWTPEDEQLIAAVPQRKLVPMALEGEEYINEVVRKSIWYYITHEYGEQKISEIVYLVNISHSIESGVISVLGITLNTLTQRWRTFIEKRLKTRGQGREILEELPGIESVVPPKGYEVIGMDYDVNSDRFAVLLNKSGAQTLMLYEQGTHTWIPTKLKAGVQRPDMTKLDLQTPIAWHPDGSEVVFPIWQKSQYVMAAYKVAEQEWEFVDIPAEISRVFTVSWSHNGQQLAVGALHEGARDVYLLDKSLERWEPLTQDPYDNIDPVFSMDDQHIIFASNRDTTSLEATPNHWQRYRYHFDLFRLPLDENASTLARITATPSIDEHSPKAYSSYEALVLTNASGITNLEKVNIFLGERSDISDFEKGITTFQVYDERLYLFQEHAGQSMLYILSVDDAPLIKEAAPSLLRLEYKAAFDARERRFAPPKAITQAPTPKPEEPEAQGEDITQPKNVEEAPKEVRYYIFDEEEPYEVRKPNDDGYLDEPQARPRRPQLTTPTTVFGDEPMPHLHEVEIGQSQQTRTQWYADYLGLGLRYDPLSRLGFKFDAGFQSIEGDQTLEFSWAPYLLARNHMFTIDYAYKKHKIDFLGRVGLTSRRLRINDNSSGFERDSLIFQYNKYYANGSARYPLSAFAAVSANVGAYFINRVDQRLTRTFLLEDQDFLASAGIRFDYDRVEEEEGYQLKGFKAFASYDYFFSAGNGATAFQRIKVDAKFYQPLVNRIVLATRVGAAFNSPRSLQQYYMGGVPDRLFQPISLPADEGIRVQSLDTSLQAIQFIDFVQPIRGFVPSVRQGSRYVVFNAELRIPLTRLMRYSLPGKRLYNIELIPFLDAGTVWVDGNPFSQKKPTDTQIIPSGNIIIQLQTLKSPFLFGFGSGIRARILGWTIRTDLAWGVDDYSIQAPLLTTSFGKNF